MSYWFSLQDTKEPFSLLCCDRVFKKKTQQNVFKNKNNDTHWMLLSHKLI